MPHNATLSTIRPEVKILSNESITPKPSVTVPPTGNWKEKVLYPVSSRKRVPEFTNVGKKVSASRMA